MGIPVTGLVAVGTVFGANTAKSGSLWKENVAWPAVTVAFETRVQPPVPYRTTVSFGAIAEFFTVTVTGLDALTGCPDVDVKPMPTPATAVSVAKLVPAKAEDRVDNEGAVSVIMVDDENALDGTDNATVALLTVADKEPVCPAAKVLLVTTVVNPPGTVVIPGPPVGAYPLPAAKTEKDSPNTLVKARAEAKEKDLIICICKHHS